MVKNKKAVSIIIGYVLLVTIGIIMSVVVYNYLKTYIPRDNLSCPGGVSIKIKNYSCSGGLLNLTLEDNGRFNYAGYFIKGAGNPTEEIATINLANYFIGTTGSENAVGIKNGYIAFSREDDNFMKPGIQVTHIFAYSHPLYLIDITPIRYEEFNNKRRFVTCGDAEIKEKISC